MRGAKSLWWGRYARARIESTGARVSGWCPSGVPQVGYAAACLAAVTVLVVAGYAHNLVSLTKQIEGGASIGDSPSSVQ